MSLTTQATRTALLAAGQLPRLLTTIPAGIVTTASALDPDDAPAAGFAVSEYLTADLDVKLRAVPWARSCWIVIDSAASGILTATYTVTIGADTVSYDASSEAPADYAALLEGIRDAVNADDETGFGDSCASVVDYDGDGINDAIQIRQNQAAGLAMGCTTTGSGVTVYADAESATLQLYRRLKLSGSSPPTAVNAAGDTKDGKVWERVQGWTRFGALGTSGLIDITIGTGGYAETLNVSAASEVLPVLVSVAGHASDVSTNLTYVPTAVVLPSVLPAGS